MQVTDDLKSTAVSGTEEEELEGIMSELSKFEVPDPEEVENLRQIVLEFSAQISQEERNIESANTMLSTLVPQIEECELQISIIKKEGSSDYQKGLFGFWIEKLTGRRKEFRAYCLSQQIVTINKLLDENLQLMNEDADGTILHDLSCRLTDSLALQEVGKGIGINKRSDGQRRRTHLALFCTLFTLATQRLPFRSSFLFLDEVFDSLDENGQEAMQRWVTRLFDSKSQMRKIFIVSHSNNTTPKAKGYIRVQLDAKDGSSYKIHNDATYKGVFSHKKSNLQTHSTTPKRERSATTPGFKRSRGKH